MFSETQIGTRGFGKLCKEIWLFIVEHAILNDNFFQSIVNVLQRNMHHKILFVTNTTFWHDEMNE